MHLKAIAMHYTSIVVEAYKLTKYYLHILIILNMTLTDSTDASWIDDQSGPCTHEHTDSKFRQMHSCIYCTESKKLENEEYSTHIYLTVYVRNHAPNPNIITHSLTQQYIATYHAIITHTSQNSPIMQEN